MIKEPEEEINEPEIEEEVEPEKEPEKKVEVTDENEEAVAKSKRMTKAEKKVWRANHAREKAAQEAEDKEVEAVQKPENQEQ